MLVLGVCLTLFVSVQVLRFARTETCQIVATSEDARARPVSYLINLENYITAIRPFNNPTIQLLQPFCPDLLVVVTNIGERTSRAVRIFPEANALPVPV